MAHHFYKKDDLPLSQREREVLAGFKCNLSCSQIARRLNLSVKTVSTYKARIRIKMKAETNEAWRRIVYTEQLELPL